MGIEEIALRTALPSLAMSDVKIHRELMRFQAIGQVVKPLHHSVRERSAHHPGVDRERVILTSHTGIAMNEQEVRGKSVGVHVNSVFGPERKLGGIGKLVRDRQDREVS
jgi:hypothetical protein